MSFKFLVNKHKSFKLLCIDNSIIFFCTGVNNIENQREESKTTKAARVSLEWQ